MGYNIVNLKQSSGVSDGDITDLGTTFEELGRESQKFFDFI